MPAGVALERRVIWVYAKESGSKQMQGEVVCTFMERKWYCQMLLPPLPLARYYYPLPHHLAQIFSWYSAALKLQQQSCVLRTVMICTCSSTVISSGRKNIIYCVFACSLQNSMYIFLALNVCTLFG